MMTKERLIAFHGEFAAEMGKQFQARNAELGTATDPFANLRRRESFGVSAEQSLVVRMAERVDRIYALAKSKSREELEETLIKLANDAVLVAAYLRSKE